MANKPMITGPIKGAVKAAARKIAENRSNNSGNSDKSNIRNWTDEELYSGMDRTGNRYTDASIALRENDWDRKQHPKSAKTWPPSERARLEDNFAAAKDSLTTVFNERLRRKRARGIR